MELDRVIKSRRFIKNRIEFQQTFIHMGERLVFSVNDTRKLCVFMYIYKTKQNKQKRGNCNTYFISYIEIILKIIIDLNIKTKIILLLEHIGETLCDIGFKDFFI